MKQLLNNILLELQKTTHDGVSDFIIENGYAKFKYLDCEFYIKRRIRKLNQKMLNAEFKLYQNTQSSFPPNPPTLEEITNFELSILANGQMFIPNYIDLSKFTTPPTLIEGQMSLNISDMSTLYFKQLEMKLVNEHTWLYIGE